MTTQSVPRLARNAEYPYLIPCISKMLDCVTHVLPKSNGETEDKMSVTRKEFQDQLRQAIVMADKSIDHYRDTKDTQSRHIWFGRSGALRDALDWSYGLEDLSWNTKNAINAKR